jgi:hypothetical protein
MSHVCVETELKTMNLYAHARLGAQTPEALTLSERLAAWHDEMVAHERRIRDERGVAACHDECPHAEARELWDEAVAVFGSRAGELAFLRSRATGRLAG